jgi:hypothetical protein
MAIRFDEFDFGDMGGLDYYNPYQTITPEVMVNPYQNYYEPALPSIQPEQSYYTYGAIPSADVFDYEADNRRAFEEAERIRVAEELRQAELIRQEQIRQAEIQRRQAEQEAAARQAEAARVAEQQRQEQIAREQELQRLAQQQEVARVAQEQQAARLAAEEAARVQEPVGALTPVPEPEPSVKEPIAESPEPVGALTPIKEEPMYTSALPSEERNIVTALPGTKPEPGLPVEEPVVPTPFVEGADVPASTGLNMGALDELFANLRKTEELQKMALEPGLLQQGFTGATGAPSAPTGTGIYVPQAAPSGPAIDFNVTPEMAGALQAVARPAEITAAERAAVTENPRVQALNRISGLLEADDFRGAFDAALQAEQDLGGDFIGNLVDPNKMKMLRGPMDANEIAKFYNEMPESVFTERYLGPGNEFKKEQAIERNIAALGGEAGYADPTLGVKKEETLLGKLPIKELAALAAAAMGATAIPGLFGAGSAGGAGAAGGAAGAGGAGAAGAGAAGAGAAGLTGVVPTGLVAGTTAANLALPVFTVTAGGGLTAAQVAALAAAGGAGAAASGAGGASTGSAASTPTTPEPPLEEVVVTGSKAPVIPPAVAAPAVGALTNVVAEPSITEPPLEEVVIETTKPTEPPVVTPPVVTTPSTPVDTVTPEGPLDEVVIETTKPTEPPVITPPVVTTPSTPVDTVTPEGPLDEVVVETTKPTEPPVITPPVVTTPSTPVDTVSPEGPLDEVVIETTKPTPPPDLVIPPVVIPPTTPVDIPKEPTKINKPDPLKDLLDKYGTLENFLKLLGALGSAGSGSRGGGTAPSMPSMGGALPKYTYTRQQLSPDIDYYTYGTRPEAKFFDYTTQLEKPVQPELPPAKPPGEDVPMATGGLTGYAKGGSKSSRYVDGPGSGREDKIPALLSDGEYVIDAETLALLGDGSTKEGARRMDKFRANIRKHKGRALSRGRISPNAKSPSKYMGGGLT